MLTAILAMLELLTFLRCFVVIFNGWDEHDVRFGRKLVLLFFFTIILPALLFAFLFTRFILGSPLESLLLPRIVFWGFMTFAIVIALIQHVVSGKNPLDSRLRTLKSVTRWNAILFFITLQFLITLTPKLTTLARVEIHFNNLRTLHSLREAVAKHRKEHGEYPQTLAEAGKVPPVNVWPFPAPGKRHRHRKTDEVELIDAGRMKLAVRFWYPAGDAESVFLVGDFNGWNPKKGIMRRKDDSKGIPDAGGLLQGGRAWTLNRTVSSGVHEYGFVVDGEKKGTIRSDFRFPMPEKKAEYAADIRPADLPDTGKWCYDPETGHVFICCTGLDPKLRKFPLYSF